MRKLAIVVMLVGAFATIWHVSNSRRDDNLVRRYCTYGAVSRAQLSGCRDHVTADYVRASDSHAARFAKLGGDCLSDAGPFCARQSRKDSHGFINSLRDCQPAYEYGGRGGC